MSPLVEIVPNLSEGRDESKVSALGGALAEGAYLLDVHSDPSHHRTVLTAAARVDGVVDAVLALAASAIELIDLREHRGAHPRIGALDVLPFVPLDGLALDSAIELARRTGGAIARRFDLPVFLYGRAAADPGHRELSELRRGGFEALAQRFASGELVPDYGPGAPHPSAGAVAVGARDFLIAYNVNLKTSDVAVARAVAKRVRARDGGLPYVKALGLLLPHLGLAQVSMNLTDFRVTPLETAFDAVVLEASELGVEVAGSEIVGLVPLAAAFEGMERRLKLDRPPGILEERLRRYLMP